MTLTPRYYTALTLATFLAACGDSTDPGNAKGGREGNGTGTGPVATSSVSVVDNSFNPSSITVTAGTTVTWSWAGNNQHNVTFDDSKDDSITQSDGNHTRTFDDVGGFPYHCSVHGASIMSGVVTVTTP